MFRHTDGRLITAVAVTAIGVFFNDAANAQSLKFTDSGWQFQGDSTRVEAFDGRETLRMETGGAQFRGAQLENGTIDLDVMTSERRSFVYVHFRMQDEAEYEEFYLRPHKSLMPDAVQYAPAYQGQSAWQLYYGSRGTTALKIVPDVWQHLRIVVSGQHAAFFLDDTVKPFMVVPHLARDPRAGFVGLSAFLPPGTPGSGPIVRYANLRISPNTVPYSFANIPAEPELSAGTIRTWEVGEAFAAPDSALTAIAPEWTAKMTRVEIEPDGFVELHRHLKMPKVTRYAGTVARVRVTADKAGLRRLDLGFSDRVTVFLNGQPIFHRDDSYDYVSRRDGLISFDQAAVYLPLRAGLNDISLIVTDRFGGWGVMGRFPEMSGLKIMP
jgi:hypothetical protein